MKRRQNPRLGGLDSCEEIRLSEPCVKLGVPALHTENVTVPREHRVGSEAPGREQKGVTPTKAQESHEETMTC